VFLFKGNGHREEFSVQKTLGVVQLRQMKDALIYVNKNTVIECV